MIEEGIMPDQDSNWVCPPSGMSRSILEREVYRLCAALELIRDWELDPGDDAEYVHQELTNIAADTVGPRGAVGQNDQDRPEGRP